MPRDDFLEHFRLNDQVHADHTLHIAYYGSIRVEERWISQKLIGQGGFGDVWKQEYTPGYAAAAVDTRVRAVKIINKRATERVGVDFKKELLALSKFSKEEYRQAQAFVDFLGWYETADSVFFAMEFFRHGDLSVHIASIREEDEIRDITMGVLRGLNIMHTEGFTHRDLKPQNIFVTHRPPESQRWRVKVGDFGISKRVISETTALRTKVGTALYQAPEVMDNLSSVDPRGSSDYDSAVDMWSLGCVVYNLAAGAVPFTSTREIFAFCLGAKPLAEAPLKHKMGEEGISFVKKLLQPLPSDRISVQDAMSDSWLQDYHLKVEWNGAPSSWAESVTQSLISDRLTYEDGATSPSTEPVSQRLTGDKIIDEDVATSSSAEPLTQRLTSDQIIDEDVTASSWAKSVTQSLISNRIIYEDDASSPSAEPVSQRLTSDRTSHEDEPRDPEATQESHPEVTQEAHPEATQKVHPEATTKALPSSRVDVRSLSSFSTNTIPPSQPSITTDHLGSLDRARGHWSLLLTVPLPGYDSRMNMVSSLLEYLPLAAFLPDNRFIDRTKVKPLLMLANAQTGQAERMNFTEQRLLDPMRELGCLASVSPVKFEVAMTAIGSRDNHWRWDGRIYFANVLDQTAYAKTCTLPEEWRYDEGLRLMQHSRDGNVVLCLGEARSGMLWDIGRRRQIVLRRDKDVLHAGWNIRRASFSGVDRYIATATSVRGTVLNSGIEVWDTATGLLVQTLRLTGHIVDFSFLPSQGDLIMVVVHDKARPRWESVALLWDMVKDTVVSRTPIQHDSEFDDAFPTSFSPDGNLFASAHVKKANPASDLGESDWSSNIEIRDARTMELQKVIPFNGEGRFLTFSPDASLLLLHVIHHQGELRDYFRSFEVYSIAR